MVNKYLILNTQTSFYLRTVQYNYQDNLFAADVGGV